jgi:ribosomal protein L11 methyltransferase
VRFQVPDFYIGVFLDYADNLSAVSSAFEIEHTNLWEIQFFFEFPPKRSELEISLALLAKACGLPEPELEIFSLPARDWVADVQRQFQPIMSKRFFVHAESFTDSAPSGLWPICITPGRAFGTGSHPTTYGCLLALEKIAKKHSHIKNVWDVGCGSGILAIAAAHLWRSAQITATDYDKIAISVAKDNAKKNRLANKINFFAAAGLRNPEKHRQEKYQIIVANILAAPLMKMASTLCLRLQAGGFMILSGLLMEQAELVLHLYQAQGLRLIKIQAFGEWAVLLLQAPADFYLHR